MNFLVLFILFEDALQGLRTMEKESQKRLETSFDKLEGEQQDEILIAFEKRIN
ncbi:gluconate 2-dehydrogenase subunit 3 family protein [Pseudogracilibacillus sp. SO30301A]|uniref:gluconate 2-dehydrogenase subunit 3 family protein n=1 Tax=Pseudogracilibacillus sp. SO30301A TaxID=3098291 RepID=UPI003FA7940A